MSKTFNVKMKDIIKNVSIRIYKEEITYCCTDIQTINDFFEICDKNEKIENADVIEFLLKNESKIDKSKLLLLIINNYEKYIEYLTNEMYKYSNNDTKMLYYLKQIKICKNILNEAIKLSKGMNDVIGTYCYDNTTGLFKVNVLDSREMVDGKKINSSKKLQRYEEINTNSKFNEFSKRNENDEYEGMEWLMQAVLLTDLYEVFPNTQFGDCIRTMLLENTLLKQKVVTRQELNKLKAGEQEAYDKFIEDNLDNTQLLKDVSKAIRDYIEYVDMDKLIMICAYRFIDGTEHEDLEIYKLGMVKETLTEIVKFLNNDRTLLKCKLQDQRDSYNLKDVKLSVQDIKDCIKQFTGTSYLTKKDINSYRQQAKNNDINLCDIEEEKMDIIFSSKDLENIAILNDDNFIIVSKKLQWDREKIINKIEQKGNCTTGLLMQLINDGNILPKDIVQLYMNKIIDGEQIEKSKSHIDLTEEITPEKLERYYNDSINQNTEKQKLEKEEDFRRYLELYKEVLIKGNKQQLQLYANELMEKVVDDYSKDKRNDYIQKVETYYKEGIITIESLLEWDDEKIISELYNDKLIDLEQIKELAKKQKISLDYISRIYLETIDDTQLDYDERLNYLRTGFISEEKIFELYRENMIFESDMHELVKLGIINKENLQQILDNITKEGLERESSIKLGNLNMLTKRNNDIYTNSDDKDEYIYDNSIEKSKIIIDPNEREEFINLFGARRAEAYLDEDNPFYNYEFYVIPDETGDIGLNSVVIAERYYDNKDTGEKFSTNNATYFFKYKDLMVLGKMKKSEMNKERKNIVFTVNHNLANEKRNGTWAIKMIYNFAKTMLSDDLTEYNKENQAKIVLEKLSKVYSHDQIMKLIDKADDIDSGKYLYYVEEGFVQDITRKNNIVDGKDVDNDAENDVADDNKVSIGDEQR